MKEQTAVEWFMDNIPTRFKNALLDMCKAEIEQANKMFEEQVIDAYETSHISMMTAEQYYNETYESK
jgi:hypothetical protein